MAAAGKVSAQSIARGEVCSCGGAVASVWDGGVVRQSPRVEVAAGLMRISHFAAASDALCHKERRAGEGSHVSGGGRGRG